MGNTLTESNCRTDLREPSQRESRPWIEKSIERFKKALQVRHHELRLGLAQTQQESQTAQHDYGKDEGESRQHVTGKRNTPLSEIS